jgi:hypothetical protein
MKMNNNNDTIYFWKLRMIKDYSYLVKKHLSYGYTKSTTPS